MIRNGARRRLQPFHLLRVPRRVDHWRTPATVAAEDDIASVAEHLADLTRTVEAMEVQLKEVTKRADNQQHRSDSQQERTEVQQERIDLAARELADVSERLQAAANALRESI